MYPHGLFTGAASLDSSLGSWVLRGRVQKSLEVLAQKLRNVILLLSIGQTSHKGGPASIESREIDALLDGSKGKRACVQGWEEFVNVFFNLLYSPWLTFLG